jgi:hypothetical protein
MIGNTTHPSYVSGVTNSDSWINQILDFQSYLSTGVPLLITTLPGSIIAGQVYLIGTGSTYGTPGDVVVFLTNLSTSAIAITPPIGFKVANFVKITGGWLDTTFVFPATSVTTFTIPTTLSGFADIVILGTAGVTISSTGGRTDGGLMGTSITTVGVYRVYQDATNTVLS